MQGGGITRMNHLRARNAASCGSNSWKQDFSMLIAGSTKIDGLSKILAGQELKDFKDVILGTTSIND